MEELNRVISLSFGVPTVEQLATEIRQNPDALKNLVEKDPELINMIMRNAEKEIKYVKITEEDQRRLREAKTKGLAEGVLIGLGIALVFALLGD